MMNLDPVLVYDLTKVFLSEDLQTVYKDGDLLVTCGEKSTLDFLERCQIAWSNEEHYIDAQLDIAEVHLVSIGKPLSNRRKREMARRALSYVRVITGTDTERLVKLEKDLIEAGKNV